MSKSVKNPVLYPYTYAEQLIDTFEKRVHTYYEKFGKRPEKMEISQAAFDIIKSYFETLPGAAHVETDPNKPQVNSLYGVELVIMGDFAEHQKYPYIPNFRGNHE